MFTHYVMQRGEGGVEYLLTNLIEIVINLNGNCGKKGEGAGGALVNLGQFSKLIDPNKLN